MDYMLAVAYRADSGDCLASYRRPAPARLDPNWAVMELISLKL